MQEVYANGDWGRYHGQHCQQLGQQMCEMLGTAHVQLCCSGTLAVELALRALQVTVSDEVILAGYDFPGNFRAIEDVGATPVLVDLAPDSWSIDPHAVEAAITGRTRAILVSHLHGTLADMPRLREIADRHGLSIVEDACQCPGAMLAFRQAGTWGDCGVWSFGGSKLLTAGRGGAMFTARAEVAQRAKVFCERGNDAFPLSELQAAVLIPQLAMLAEANEQRAKAVAMINHFLQERSVPIVAGKMLQTERSNLQTEPAQHLAAYYKLGLWYNVSQECDTPVNTFLAALQAEGVAVDRAFRGFHRRPESRCRKLGSLEQTKRAAQQTLVLHHPVLLAGTDAAEKVASAIVKVWNHFS